MRTQPNRKPSTATVQQVLGAPEQARPVVHNVHILDASGSMQSNSKYNNALKGINEEVNLLKKDKSVDYTQTFVEFDGPNYSSPARIRRHLFMSPLEKCPAVIKGSGAFGNTPLYETVGTILQELQAQVKDGEKVLVKIFTDGGENSSKGYYASPENLKRFIKIVETKGFTVTFVGTSFDTEEVITNLGIEKTNTLVHDNTGAGVIQAFQTSATATMNYSKKVLRGEDVSRSFYSKSVVK